MINRRSVLASLALAPVLAHTLAQAGQERIFVVSDGSFSLPAGMLSNNHSGDEVKAVLTKAGQPGDAYISQLNISVVERADGFVVFDCGAGQNFVPGAGKLIGALKAAGVEPEKVKHLVFTHAHPDHLWGSLDDFGAPIFPNATFHMAAVERDFWHQKDILSKLPEDRKVFATGAQRHMKELEPVMKYFTPEQEMLPGIFGNSAYGHTPGHMAYDVKIGSEIVSVVGDTFTHPLLSFAYPEWAGVFDHEPDIAAATRKRLLDKLASEKRAFIAYHLPNNGRGRVERAGVTYRLITAD